MSGLAASVRTALTGAYYSIKATKKEKRLIRVAYDGQDWVHRWRAGGFVSPRPLKRPVFECTTSIPLFTYAYRPQPGDTILDVGAGVGTELQAFSEMVGPGGRVIAIEADPTAYRCLEKLCRLLGLANVTLVRSAIGDFEGVAHLTQDDGGAITNMLASDRRNGAIEVPMTTLDSLVKKQGLERIDFLKMNIEGAEVPALKAFVERADSVRHWCISCHDFMGKPECCTFDFVNQWLSDRGLAISRHPDVPGSPWMGYYLFAH
ncbi:MAG: FkbM family methyltransferase [Rhodocyclales bacterium]|nr:FkbM family methyltransferase [Rhodocyclales bacterium]